MKLVTFQAGKELRLGVVRGDWVVDIRRAMEMLLTREVAFSRNPAIKKSAQAVLAGGPPPADLIELLARGPAWRKALNEVLIVLSDTLAPLKDFKDLLRPLKKTRLCAPIPRPGKITCVGLNYASHAREQGKEPPAQPVFFLKSNNTIRGPGDDIVLPPISSQVDYEAELAVVIGKRGKQIPEEKAYEYIAGYMILNDVSARDLQYGDRQWFRGKSCDTFGPTGPWIVTRDEIPEPHGLGISLTLNGQTMQNSNTNDLIFKIPYLVSYLSQSLTWEAGDILSTGTPGGVGNYRQPQVFLKPGDSVSVTLERIGVLANRVVGP